MKTPILSAVMTVAIVAVVAHVGRAQTPGPANHPDFSGKWAVDIQASSPGLVTNGMGLVQPMTTPTTLQPSFANAFTARQDSRTLEIDRLMGGSRLGVPMIVSLLHYRLDGSETTYVEGAMIKTASGQAKPKMASKARWQNNTLRILIRNANVDASLPQNRLLRVMSLDANGRLLIDTTLGVDPPYLTVYRRAN